MGLYALIAAAGACMNPRCWSGRSNRYSLRCFISRASIVTNGA